MFPVETLKPSVVGNVFDSSFEVPVPFGQLCHQKMLDKTFGILIEIGRKPNFAFKDVLINCHGLVIRERVNPNDHLVDKNSKTPPVYWLTMSFL